MQRPDLQQHNVFELLLYYIALQSDVTGCKLKADQDEGTR